MKKYRKIIALSILLLLIGIVVIKLTQNNTIIYYYKQNGISYIKKNKAYNISDKYIASFTVSKDNKKVLYIEYPYLYLYNTSNKKKYKIKKDIVSVEWLDNNNYIALDQKNNIYLYNNRKQKQIDKKIDMVRIAAYPYIIYNKN